MGFKVGLYIGFECDHCEETFEYVVNIEKDVKSQIQKIRKKYIYREQMFFCDNTCYHNYLEKEIAEKQRQEEIQAQFDALPEYVKRTINNNIKISDVKVYADMMKKVEQHVYLSQLTEEDYANISDDIDKVWMKSEHLENITMKVIVDAIMQYCNKQYDKLSDEVAPI